MECSHCKIMFIITCVLFLLRHIMTDWEPLQHDIHHLCMLHIFKVGCALSSPLTTLWCTSSSFSPTSHLSHFLQPHSVLSLVSLLSTVPQLAVLPIQLTHFIFYSLHNSLIGPDIICHPGLSSWDEPLMTIIRGHRRGAGGQYSEGSSSLSINKPRVHDDILQI